MMVELELLVVECEDELELLVVEWEDELVFEWEDELELLVVECEDEVGLLVVEELLETVVDFTPLVEDTWPVPLIIPVGLKEPDGCANPVPVSM